MQCCVLLKYGEMVLKGGNRRWFEQWLLTNLDDALSAWPPEHRPAVRRRGGVLVLFTSPELQDELVALARNLIGISLVQPVWRVPRSARAAETAAVELLRDHRTQDGAPTFAVRCHRRDKRFGLSSEQLAARIGARVRADLGWRVDLSHPELELTVEVDRREIFLGTRTHPGQGGLPVGSSGRAVVLLSGGFDSPVAAYRAMRRGLACDFLHCTGARSPMPPRRTRRMRWFANSPASSPDPGCTWPRWAGPSGHWRPAAPGKPRSSPSGGCISAWPVALPNGSAPRPS